MNTGQNRTSNRFRKGRNENRQERRRNQANFNEFLEAWNEIADSNPALHRLRPDIEALLVNRVGHSHGMANSEYFIAPVDECFKLVGLIRSNWRGLSGGTEVWMEIGSFFTSLRSKSELVTGGCNA
ncbi:MAG TPA: DUF5947 family protein [Terracidiphilus sp.]|nr:DUF5947 family protein [Terracidiphilus sp.]